MKDLHISAEFPTLLYQQESHIQLVLKVSEQEDRHACYVILSEEQQGKVRARHLLGSRLSFPSSTTHARRAEEVCTCLQKHKESEGQTIYTPPDLALAKDRV